MIEYVKPKLLENRDRFKGSFTKLLMMGQFKDSTVNEYETMSDELTKIHKKIDFCIDRKDESVLEPYLPPKHEFNLFIKLTPEQADIYEVSFVFICNNIFKAKN